jgi:glycerol-3-phosphate acyltransferase PlsY
MLYLITVIIGYLLGSFPTAYMLVKQKGIDITTAGTGNVGAMNSFEVTNSRYIGIFVFLIDALKGLLSVYIPLLLFRLGLFPLDFAYPALSLLAAVLAHCYNPWLQFKGGRGLATSFGGTILIAPFIPMLWLVSWALYYLVRKDIIEGNIFAILFTMLTASIFIGKFFNWASPPPDSVSTLFLFLFSLLIMIFIKHIDPFLELINKKNIQRIE